MAEVLQFNILLISVFTVIFKVKNMTNFYFKIFILCFILVAGQKAVAQDALGRGNALDRNNNNTVGSSNRMDRRFGGFRDPIRSLSGSRRNFGIQTGLFNEVDETRNTDVVEYLGGRNSVIRQSNFLTPSQIFSRTENRGQYGYVSNSTNNIFLAKNLAALSTYKFNQEFSGDIFTNETKKTGFNHRVWNYHHREFMIGSSASLDYLNNSNVYFGLKGEDSGPIFSVNSVTGIRRTSDEWDVRHLSVYDRVRIGTDRSLGIGLVNEKVIENGYKDFMHYALDSDELMQARNQYGSESSIDNLQRVSDFSINSPHKYAMQSLSKVYLPERPGSEAVSFLKRDRVRLRDELSLSLDLNNFDGPIEYLEGDEYVLQEESLAKSAGGTEKSKSSISKETIREFGQALRLANINLETLSDPKHGYVGELTKSAEEALKEGNYLWAEWKFEHVLRLVPDYPSALIGLIQARIGGEMFVSASLTLEKLMTEYPEMIGARLDSSMLPAVKDWQSIYKSLKNLIKAEHFSVEIRDGIFLLIAYEAWQMEYFELVKEGLDGYRSYVSDDDSLLLLIEEAWTK